MARPNPGPAISAAWGAASGVIVATVATVIWIRISKWPVQTCDDVTCTVSHQEVAAVATMAMLVVVGWLALWGFGFGLLPHWAALAAQIAFLDTLVIVGKYQRLDLGPNRPVFWLAVLMGVVPYTAAAVAFAAGIPRNPRIALLILVTLPFVLISLQQG